MISDTRQGKSRQEAGGGERKVRGVRGVDTDPAQGVLLAFNTKGSEGRKWLETKVWMGVDGWPAVLTTFPPLIFKSARQVKVK